ncbi:serum opacification factor [Streptococcus dysgalactiae subsp. dysgalactiae]|uniref:serum opacification factor n=1 Tax=Streptococcus dysgalactiae TaxID=1334 RepID=UPI001CF53532|nr:serum opacification factor [Streptococcus dysgalactiae]MCB2846941.1 serum opacification factor [Streptococcus dysgalactiae subsp. dysgalactiae]
MTNCKYKLRKLSIGLVSVGTMFMAAPVMGEDASQPTASRETSSASSATTSSTTQSGENQDLKEAEAPVTKALEVAEPTTAPKEAKPSSLKAEAPATAAEKGLAEAQGKELAPKTPVQAEAASPAAKATAPTNTGQTGSPEQAHSRSKRAAEIAPQAMEAETMEVEKVEVQNPDTVIKLIDDKDGKQKLIANRDGEQREIAEISREVRVSENQEELEVTLKVTPKEIDKGAEVIVLLDTSKKMTEADFKTAKENIKKLVQTLTATASDDKLTHKARVRLITFYNKVSEPIELTVDKTDTKMEEVDTAIAKAWVEAKEARNWGVDLQGAIHKAREILNKDKLSGKRQHIVLFSQGESTFSYDIKKEEKEKLRKVAVNEPVTYSNPLLFWPFYFDTITKPHNVVEDAGKLISFLNKVGITQFKDALEGIASTGNDFLSLVNIFTGIKNPLDYITLADLNTKELTEEKFDYKNRLGEGYNFRSYADRKVGTVELKSTLKAKIKKNLNKLRPTQVSRWLKLLGLEQTGEKIQDWTIDQALDKLFYHRQYQFYNHNLSAQAEAKMAADEGIIFRSFDVTMPTATNDYKKSNEKSEAEKRNDRFDAYLKEMSEDGKFFKDVDQSEKFKDLLTEVKVTETFEDKVIVEKDSWTEKQGVHYTSASTSDSWLFFLPSSTKESLTWTIDKDLLKKAFEKRKPLTLTYKLKVDKEKLKAKNGKERKATTPNSKETRTDTIISNKLSYKINNKEANGNKLEDVKLTYSRETVLVPEIFEEIEIPPTPEKPLVEIEIGGQDDIKEFTEDSLPSVSGQNPDSVEGTVVEDTQTSQEDIVLGGQGQVIDFTEDTQSGMSGDNSHTDGTVVEEDSKPSQEDEVIIGGQGQVIDFTEDTQSGMSGDNSHTDGTVLEEDSKPSQEDEVIIGGQGQVIDFTEDTQTGMSGAGQVENPTITEETHKPEIIMGGQSDPIDMVEDTLPGMSGSNEATVVEEDTRPKLQFHFDNEEPVPATVPTVSQAPITQVESKVPHAKAESALPQTGDTNKLETFFTITALTVIGAAGLLGKKRRNNQTD